MSADSMLRFSQLVANACSHIPVQASETPQEDECIVHRSKEARLIRGREVLREAPDTSPIRMT